MKNHKILQCNILIFISTVLLLFIICFSSSSITYSIENEDESDLIQRANDYLSEGEIEHALQIYDEILKVNQTNISALNDWPNALLIN